MTKTVMVIFYAMVAAARTGCFEQPQYKKKEVNKYGNDLWSVF